MGQQTSKDGKLVCVSETALRSMIAANGSLDCDKALQTYAQISAQLNDQINTLKARVQVLEAEKEALENGLMAEKRLGKRWIGPLVVDE